MLYRLRDRLERARFNASARAVLATPPLSFPADGVTIVSQLQSKDVIPYLVAAKSFYATLRRGRFVIVSDGTLSAEDRRTLSHHLAGVTFRELADGHVEGLPRGGTWERLCVIARECRDAYVMQLDADTVTLGPLDAVAGMIAANRPFAIADAQKPGRATPAELAEFHGRRGSDPSAHIQLGAEMALARSTIPPGRMYLRGSSGFAGFPKGADVTPLLFEIHAAMSAAIAGQWSQWGSEQVASNYAVANLGDAAPLAPPSYANHVPATDVASASFIHFYGTHRHHRGRYVDAARRAIAKLASDTA